MESLEDRNLLSTFTVMNTNDNGAGSLRQAIVNANSQAGLDSIAFSIPGVGPHRISVLSPLPVLTDAVVIDGYTQPGSAPATDTSPAVLQIELNGSQGATGNGLRIDAPSCTVRGLAINGFPASGIEIQDTGALVEGNYIGTDVTGTAALSNRTGILLLQASGNQIGGPTPASRNVIAGNAADGIQFNSGATTNRVVGNFIGTNAAGTVAVPNGGNGITVAGSNGANQIGGTTAGESNVISGNAQRGIFVGIPFGASSNNRILGNYIGTAADGITALGNGQEGVRIGDFQAADSSSNRLEGNVIAFNGSDGVAIHRGAGNAVLGNAIFSNGGLGIDLRSNNPFSNGVTPNDPGDADGGGQPVPGNNFQNYPVLTSATDLNGTTVVAGDLNSLSGTAFRLEFFASSSRDPSGHGEGQRFLGFLVVTTDAGGLAGGFTFPSPVPLAEGEFVTATATRIAAGGNLLDTSEFSAALEIAFNRPPVAVTDPPASTAEDTPVALSVLANDSDPDGDPVRLTGAAALHGAVAVHDNGTPDSLDDFLTYTPDLDFHGTDTVTYLISDGNGGSASATVAVTVTAVNDSPQISDVSDAVMNEDTASGVFTFTVTDVDTTAESLLLRVTSSNLVLVPEGGIVLGGSGTGRTVTVTPTADRSGTATITLTIEDGSGGTAAETFEVTVLPVNDAPSFTMGDVIKVVADAGPQTRSGWATGASPGPTDEAGQTLSFSVTTSDPTLFTVPPAIAADGTLTFTPAANVVGVAIVGVALVDDGGVERGGQDTSALHNFRIEVVAVPDPGPKGTPAPPSGKAPVQTLDIRSILRKGGAYLQVVNPTTGQSFTFRVYAKRVKGGVAYRAGDITGDGVEDVVGVGRSEKVPLKVFDGRTGGLLAVIPAAQFRSLLTTVFGLVIEDRTGDGKNDIVVEGKSPKGKPKTVVYDPQNKVLLVPKKG